MSGADPKACVFIVGSDGVARIGAANDHLARVQQRQNVAQAASTPDGLTSLIEEQGLEKAAALLHDAMFGRLAARETPADTPAGDVARRWT
jgi:hypothetical protein